MAYPVKQPNGLYALWSSIVEDFEQQNLTIQDLLLWAICEEGLYKGPTMVARAIQRANQLPDRWDKCLETLAGSRGKGGVYEAALQAGTESMGLPQNDGSGRIWALAELFWLGPFTSITQDLEVLISWNLVEGSIPYGLKVVRHIFSTNHTIAWLSPLDWQDPSQELYLNKPDQPFTVALGSQRGSGVVWYANIPDKAKIEIEGALDVNPQAQPSTLPPR